MVTEGGPAATTIIPSASASASPKDRYLEVAAQLAVEHVPPGQIAYPLVVSSISMADAGRRAGVGRSTMYRLWPSKYDFWADLVRYIAMRDLQPSGEASAEYLVGGTTDWDAVLRYARKPLNDIYAGMKDDPWVPLRAALQGSSSGVQVDELVGGIVADAISEITYAVDDSYAAFAAAIRPPLVTRHHAAMAHCIGDAFASAHRVSAVVAEPLRIDGRDEPWSLYSYVVMALVEVMAAPGTSRLGQVEPPMLHVWNPEHEWNEPKRQVLAAAANLFGDRVRNGSTGTVVRRGPRDAPATAVTMQRLARRAGVSTQALQHVWPHQQALDVDLMRLLWRRHYHQQLAWWRRALRRAYTSEPDTMWLSAADEVIRRQLRASNTPHVAYATHIDRDDLRAVARAETESVVATFAADLEAIITAIDGTLREGLSSRHLATTLLLVAPAVGRLARTNPDEVPDVPWDGTKRTTAAVLLGAVMSASVT